MGEINVGDRVRAKDKTLKLCGHVIEIDTLGISPFAWVRDIDGTQWGLPVSSLEHID